jgi:hypothetical protein
MKKIYAKVTLDIVMRADEDADINEVINEASAAMIANGDKADIEDVNVSGVEITDSK